MLSFVAIISSMLCIIKELCWLKTLWIRTFKFQVLRMANWMCHQHLELDLSVMTSHRYPGIAKFYKVFLSWLIVQTLLSHTMPMMAIHGNSFSLHSQLRYMLEVSRASFGMKWVLSVVVIVRVVSLVQDLINTSVLTLTLISQCTFGLRKDSKYKIQIKSNCFSVWI